MVLNHQDQVFAKAFQRHYFVIHLNQSCLGRHFPIQAIGAPIFCIIFFNQGFIRQESLPCRPYSPGCIKSLQFDGNKIYDLVISR